MSILAKSKGEVTYKDLTGFHKWFLIILISMGSSIIYTPMYLKGVFYDPLMTALGCTNADLGAMVSFYGIVALICYLPSGIIADKFRMRTLAWVGFVGTAVLTFLYAMLPSVQMCYVLFGGMGLTSILIWWGTRFKVIRLCCEEDEYPARIGVSYSIYGVTGLVVGVINAAIIAAIPDTVFAMQSVIIFLGVLIAILGVLSFVFIPDFKGEINKDAKLFSIADAAEAIKAPGVLWACLGYFCVYCVYQGATYTTPYLSQAMGTDANTVNIIGLIRTYGIGLLAGPVIGAIAAKAKSSKTIIGCFALAIVVLGAFIVMPQDSGLSIVPMRIFGTAAGILSVIGFLPDVFIHTWYGSLIDASGVAAFNQIFGFEIMFAVLGIIFLVMCIRAIKKHAASQAN